ncbi:DUF3369 domain-containing protein [Litorivivens sp.]|uniref:DUF3369 domain-containing protein n=1 Tax=Litorivivens sp. TaxID=2020868 RepID=UPI0035656880
MSSSDALRLASDDRGRDGDVPTRPWHLLVVDDDEEIHTVTRLAMHGFECCGRPLEIHSAYSGAEAIDMLRQRDDIALILLDVVMETETAGLDCVHKIRNELGNQFVRIVLRTGQPGQAPEYKVITEYDINDYKEKTELTRQKLFTCVYTSLTSYRDLVALDRNRKGLVKVIDSSADLFDRDTFDGFAQGVIEQLAALLYLEQDFLVLSSSGLALEKPNGHIQVVASTGQFAGVQDEVDLDDKHPLVRQRIEDAMKNEYEQVFGADYFVACYNADGAARNILYITGEHPIDTADRTIVELFARNVAIAHHKLLLIERYQELLNE